jgi:hypothetical protein
MWNPISNYRQRWRFAALLAIGVALPASDSSAFDVFWTNPGTSAWTTQSNWDTGEIPDFFFEDVPIINNGGTATLNTLAPNAAGLVLGQNPGNTGKLIIQSGGSLTLVETTGAPVAVDPLGQANIGLTGGSGHLHVMGGGTFVSTLPDVNTGSILEIGGGAGAASVTSTDGMWLAGRTITHGPGHTFAAATFVNFEGGSEYVLDLQASTHTTLVAAGPIGGVQGPLVVGFSSGYTPSIGTTWTILDGSAVNGVFGSVDTSSLLTLPAPGTRFVQSIVNGGNGRQLKLSYQAVATLNVNASTGAMSIASESNTPVSIIGYSIDSAGGSLSPTGWSSLDDQNVGGANVWQEASPTANSLSELVGNTTGTLALNSTPRNLGNGYAFAPAAFGDSPDIQFEYLDAAGQVVDGIVKYTGAAAYNNLLLTVDPATGNAQLKNSSNFSISLVGYSIESDAGSLQAGNSDWSSLDDQNVGGANVWVEAAPTSNALSELISSATASLTLGPGQSYLLGDLFDNVTGDKDLTLDFALAGETTGRQGIVVYDTIAAGVPGDYNNDGAVNAADYTVYRDNLGLSAAALSNRNPANTGVVNAGDYTFWTANYGSTSAAVSLAVSVPEPTGVALAVSLLGGLWLSSRRRD